MIEMARDLQVLFLAGVLLLACAAKLTVRETDHEPVVALHRRRAFVYGVALAEGVLGLALLVTPAGAVRLACAVFFASATLAL